MSAIGTMEILNMKKGIRMESDEDITSASVDMYVFLNLSVQINQQLWQVRTKIED